jgi:aspartate/methionine/tyrosine aminotransferase
VNPLLTGIAPSIIRELHGRKGSSSIDLGLGEPTLRPEMGPLRQAMEWVEANGCPYSPNAGLAELRRALSAHFALPGLDDPACAGVTVGSQEALYVALKALLDPATDEALIVSPAYPLYGKLCAMEGVAARQVSLSAEEGFRPDAGAVLAAVGARTRVVVLASPSNPTGRVWPPVELQRLAEGLLALPSPSYIVSDEVYRELYFGDAPPESPARFYPRTVVVGSLSKSCALTGLRLGWFLAPREVAPALLKVHQFAVSCASTYAQQVALSILREPALFSAHRPHYAAQREALLAGLAEAGLSGIAPEGAFYCLVRLRGEAARDSTAAAFALLKRKDVVAIPGATFGAEGFLRVSFVAPQAQLREGLLRIAAFLDEGME